MGAFLTTTLLGWLTRRVAEIGGVLLAASAMDPTIIPAMLETVGALLTGNFDDVSLGAIIGLVSTAGGLIWNARSTFKSQVVVHGQKVDMKDLPPSTRSQVTTSADNQLTNKGNLLERLFGKK